MGRSDVPTGKEARTTSDVPDMLYRGGQETHSEAGEN